MITEKGTYSILPVPPDAISLAAICEPPRLGIRLGVCEKSPVKCGQLCESAFGRHSSRH